MNNKIKFSIIMAAFNAEKYINQAIKSVLEQTYTNWELIIVDDGSSDNTKLITDNYAKSDTRIIVVHQENSGTASAARNRALKLVSGDYTQMLDSDDIISTNMLASYNNIIVKTKPDIIVPNCECFSENGKIIYKKFPPNNDYSLILDGITAFKYSLDWSIHGFFCVKAELVKKIKYDAKIINGDEFTTRKLFYNANIIAFSNEYYFYRENLQSTTRNKKNAARMYESLITDLNIFRYSIDSVMPYSVQKLCAIKVITSLIYHELKFIEEKHEYSLDEQRFIVDIFYKVYKKAGKKAWKCSNLKYIIFYSVWGVSYEQFEKKIYLLYKSKRLLKKFFKKHLL